MTAPKPSLGERPSRMKPADLGSAFGGSSRSDGLGGRLAPLRAAPPVPQISPPRSTPERTSPEQTSEKAAPAAATPTERGTDRKQPAQAPAPKPRPVDPVAKATARPAPDEDLGTATKGASQTIVVYLGLSVRERLRAGAGDRTFTEVVLTALDTTYNRLADRFAAPAPPSGSLFAGRGLPRARRNGEARVQISLRPLRDDLTVIDSLVAEVNAPSRSALIDAALDEYLPPEATPAAQK